MKRRMAAALMLTASLTLGMGSGAAAQEADAASAQKAGTEAEAANVQEASTEAEAASAQKAGAQDGGAFAEVPVVDNEECLIKITGVEPDNMWGYTLNAYMENKSADKTYMFSVDTASVNGVQSDPFFAAEIAPGKKSNETISFSDTALQENGIEEFTDLELSFRVYDSEDWEADPVAEETVHVYPLGEEKAEPFVRESQPTDTPVMDNNEAAVIVTGYSEDDIWGYTMHLYLLNKTDRRLMFSADEVSVNGFMADPFWATEVGAGKSAFSSMSWADSDFEENGIQTVEEIELQLRIYDSEDWTGEDIFCDTVTLNP